MVSILKNLPLFSKLLFFTFGILIIILNLSPATSLIMGLLIGIIFTNPFPNQSRVITKYLLQISIVGLGFGMNFEQVLEAGKDGFVFTLVTIALAMGLGFLLGRWLKVDDIIAYLISCGTAVCGGSAIAAVSQVLKAENKDISVSIGTVFILNAVALFIFPVIGHYFNLSQQQFGLWAAIAIHDTSSVVGASAKYGNEALAIATTVKLARALWIIPLVVLTSVLFNNKGSAWALPWFIVFFIAASIVNTYINIPVRISSQIFILAKLGFSITLFLIGCGISLDSLKKVGVRPFLQGVLLWIIILSSSLFFILHS